MRLTARAKSRFEGLQGFMGMRVIDQSISVGGQCSVVLYIIGFHKNIIFGLFLTLT